MNEDRPVVALFRKELLPWSETFVAAQGGALSRWRAVFVGYARGPAFDEYLAGQDCVLLADHAASPALAKGALKGLGVMPPGWRAALARRRPRLVHAHFGTNALDAIPVARSLRLPLVVTYHGSDIAKDPRRPRHLRLRHRVFRAVDRVIAVSEFIAERLRANGCPPDKITVHHIGVDTERFAPDDAVEREDAQVLFVGRLVGKKGLVHLLRAMPEVQRAVPGAELLVVGDGPLRGELEAEAERLGARVRFEGVLPPEQVRDRMRRAAVLCAPSVVTRAGDAEGLPMTVVEAQAAGLPVVASPSGGTAEGIVDGETGRIVPSGDEPGLAAALVSLLADPGRRARFGRAARRHAVENFDLRRQTAMLERIYDEVAAGG